MGRLICCLLLPSTVALLPASARASVFGEENATLAAILLQATQTLDAINKQLSTAKKTYEEIRRYASYADEAAQAFKAARHFNFQAQSFEALAGVAFPDAVAIERDATRQGFWRSTGELSRLTRYCLDDRIANPQAKTFQRCIELEDALTAAKARSNLENAFGGPARTASQKAVDDTAATAMATSHSHQQAAALTHVAATSLAQQCTQGSSATECQAAANAASIAQLAEASRTNDQLAEANRLQALRLTQENERRKAETEALETQGRTALDAFQQATQAAPRIDFHGLEEQ